MVITTQEDIDRIKARWDPVELEEMLKNKRLALPKVGQLLPKQLRAKKLMSQKATSVADLAFVLGLQTEGPDPEEAARLKEERRKAWWNNISKGAKARARKRAKLQEAKEQQLEARRRMAMKPEVASLGLDSDTATRIAMEYRGAMIGNGDQVDLTKREANVEEEGELEDVREINGQDHHGVEKVSTNLRGPISLSEDVASTAQEKQPHEQLPFQSTTTDNPEAAETTTEATTVGTDLDSLAAARAAAQEASDAKEVRVLWADLRDAAYAESWPETVVHAELERMAVAKSRVVVPNGQKEVLVARSRTVHVIGGQKGSGWYLDRDELEQQMREIKQTEPALELGEADAAEEVQGVKEVATEENQDSQEYARREAATEALREKGIEVETPRRGVWARVKALVGR